MLILLLMMTIVKLGSTKRVRKEPQEIPDLSTNEGSESELDPKLCTLRQRKCRMPSVAPTGGGNSRENTQSTSIPRISEGSVSNTTSKTTERLLRQNKDSFRDPSTTVAGGSGSTEDNQPPSLALADEGNISNTIDRMVSQTGQSQAPNERRRRGPNINKKASQILDKQPGARIKLTMDNYTKKFLGDSAISFSTEVGIVMRGFCSIEFHTWEKVEKENKEEMIDRLREKFELPHEDKALMEYVDDQMQRQWKRTRNTLKDYWKKNGGMTDPQLARSKIKPNCRSKEDWEHLCKYWESEKAQNYADQMKHNRAKLMIPSRGGSRSIANHKFAMTNKETQMPPSPIELYHKLHFNSINKWINDESRIQYENIVKMKEEECEKLVLAGTIMTKELEYDIEKKVVKAVCAKHKTLLSGREASSGPVMRKKDIPILSARETSQSASKDEVDMKSQIDALNEKLKENEEKRKEGEEKYEKLLQFVISKFPDSHDILGSRDKDGVSMRDDMADLSDQE